MTSEEILFCDCIRLALHSQETPSFSDAQITQIENCIPVFFSMAREHNLLLSLYDSLCRLDISWENKQKNLFRQTVAANCFNEYHMLSFTRKVLSILQEEKISYYLLKGVSLLNCYPKFEFRSFNDMDILVTDSREFQKLVKRLSEEGFYQKDGFAEHHLEMFYEENGHRYLLEIHSKVIARQANASFNREVKKIFAAPFVRTDTFAAANLTFSTLPITHMALHLLLHKLQHFLGSGFGVKLLCDWTLFLEQYGMEIDRDTFQKYLNILGLSGFCNAMTALCQKYMGLQLNGINFLRTEPLEDDYLEQLMGDILSAGEFGKNDQSRMLIMSGGGRFSQYFHELHRQMKRRFHKLHKIKPLWPFLWVITGICFLWNNHFIRKTKTSEILATTKKRQNLLKKLHLYR